MSRVADLSRNLLLLFAVIQNLIIHHPNFLDQFKRRHLLELPYVLLCADPSCQQNVHETIKILIGHPSPMGSVEKKRTRLSPFLFQYEQEQTSSSPSSSVGREVAAQVPKTPLCLISNELKPSRPSVSETCFLTPPVQGSIFPNPKDITSTSSPLGVTAKVNQVISDMRGSNTNDNGTAQNSKDSIIDFVAGSLGAATSVYVGQPLDTLKVKMQTFPEKYPNLGICFRETLRKEGVVRGLYAGTVPSLAANMAENSILFAAYGVCQKSVANLIGVRKVSDLSVTANGFSGSFAAFFASFALCPTELIKCRLQAMRESQEKTGSNAVGGAGKPKIGPFALTKQILKQDGIQGMFRGLAPTFMREMPGYFCFFFAYEFSRELFAQPGQAKDEIGPLKTIISGGLAGTTLWTVIFPADVIKSRQQVSGVSESMLKTAKDLVRKDGALALYNGLTPTLIRTFPATGALFFAFEYSKKFMQSLS
ncbi:mitochondrial ornithine transporter 1-like isoform X1 [Tigriopus californicus]|uniref:mitochondrial ornithine transporter 1-like isoform X1 n=1 Tax=Tigriopus californicus TaxID=6832 RepID=UPI0027DA04C7|nr:mitochondrial ornithine transporter 1-like isoform X1 [Tigriopus californicus]